MARTLSTAPGVPFTVLVLALAWAGALVLIVGAAVETREVDRRATDLHRRHRGGADD